MPGMRRVGLGLAFLLSVAAIATAEPKTPAPAVAASVPAAKPTRIYSRGQTTWIWAEPKKTRNGIGYVRLGQSVALRGEEPKKGPGCADLYYPVEPYGWVCLDRTATLSGDARWQKAMQLAAPRSGLMPFGYALSNGAPMYRRLPTPSEVERERRMFGEAGKFRPQSWGNRGHERLAEVRAIATDGDVPWFLREGGSASREKEISLLRRQIPHGSMLSYTRAFEQDGRTYLLSADGTVVPADRVRPYRTSKFHGAVIGKDARLPLAFMRAKARPQYRATGDGVERVGGDWPLRSYVELAPDADPVEVGGKRYLVTRARDAAGKPLLIDEADATLIRPRDKLPIGVSEGAKWLLFSITDGTLVAYSGLTPLYATLASPGAGGVPIKGKDPVKMSTTPLGVYRVTFKHRATTMSPEYGENRSFWIADVPYTQYFNAPFALHTAYWHEDFGEPMSAGCVNLSPIDGAWLFDWTDPKVPPGWGGAGPGGPHGSGTYVVVAR